MLEQFDEICETSLRGLKIQLVDELMSSLKVQLEKGMIDVAFMPDMEKYSLDTQHFGWKYVEFGCLNVVVSQTNPLAVKDTVVLTDIIDIPIVAFSRGENTAAMSHIRDMFRPYGKNPSIVDYITSDYQISATLKKNDYMFIAGPHFLDAHLEGCKKIPITDQRSGTIAVWNKGDEREYIQTFINLLRDYNQAYGLY